MADTDTLNFDLPPDGLQLASRAYTVMRYVADGSRDAFDLNPPFQRGFVWGRTRQQNLIRSLLIGLPIGSITLNERTWSFLDYTAPYAVIDGKQRIEAVRNFVNSVFPIPATWIPEPHQFIQHTEDVTGWPVPGVRFENTSHAFRAYFLMLPMPGQEARVATLEEEAEIYRLLNTGGVEQTEADLHRAATIENGNIP